VGGQVVQHDVDLLAGVWGLTAFFRNARKSAPLRVGLHSPRPRRCHVQGGEQVGGAVPDVVVGAFLGGVERDRQQRLGPVQGLDLGLLVEAEHDRPAGRIQVQPDDVGDLLRERRVLAELERALPVRFEPCSRATASPPSDATPTRPRCAVM
jgi:hypothetical protein